MIDMGNEQDLMDCYLVLSSKTGHSEKSESKLLRFSQIVFLRLDGTRKDPEEISRQHLL